MKRVFVESVGIAATGLADWPTARAVLRGESSYAATPLAPYQPQLLAPNERRRVMPAVRQAFRVAEEAVTLSGRAAADLATVFVSSEADVEILHRISSSLAEPSRLVSPTDFHNSVHNAAAGYWTIAVGARRVSTTLCAYDCGFSSALVEAATLLDDEPAVLVVVYDVPPPAPLFEKRPITSASSMALVLTAERTERTMAALDIDTADSGRSVSRMPDSDLEALRGSNPALRALPVLEAIARGTDTRLDLENAGGYVSAVRVSPPA